MCRAQRCAGRGAGWDVRIVGVDRHAVTAAEAGEAREPRLAIVRADVFNLPFEAGSFDYAMTSMFLHHLDEEEVVAVLAAMNRLAKRGVIVADLLRHRRAYVWSSAADALRRPDGQARCPGQRRPGVYAGRDCACATGREWDTPRITGISATDSCSPASFQTLPRGAHNIWREDLPSILGAARAGVATGGIAAGDDTNFRRAGES